MNFLKKQHSVILFFVALIAVLEIGNTFRIALLVKRVEAFEPVVIEYVEPQTTPVPKSTPEVVPEPTPEPTPEPQPDIESIYELEIPLIAKTVWGEAQGCSKMEQAAVIWCILNRVDSKGYGFGHGIEYVITFPNQFHGYNPNFPVTDEIYDLTVDVLERWEREKSGETDVGRVLPKEYLYFSGNGTENIFRTEYTGGDIWRWNCVNPYIN